VTPQPHLTITGVSTYTGPTTIQSGILGIGATGSVLASSSVNLSDATSKLDVTAAATGYPIPSAQKLTGLGDWDGRILLDGTLAPGDGIAAMSGDDLTFDGPGTMQFELSTADNSSDGLTLSGAFDKGTAGPFRFDFANGGANGKTYTLVQFGSTTFAARDFTYSNLAPGLIGNFLLSATDLKFVVIPEPGALASLAGGMGVLFGLRRFRRS
jgi:autotransporter-associated beta strand protein